MEKAKSFVETAKSGVKWTFLQQVSVQIINFGVQILLARLLMPSDFGLIAMISVFIAIGQSLSDSGMTSSLIRNAENSERDYGTVFITNFAVSLLIYLCVYLLAPFIASFYEQNELTNILRVYGLVFVVNSFTVVQMARFSKQLDFKSQFVYQLPSVVIGAITGLLMAFWNFGVWSLVGLNIMQALSFGISLWLFHSWRPMLVFDVKLFKSHFNYGYKLTLSSLLTTIYLNLYKVLIGKRYSPMEVGFFNQADNLRSFPVNQMSNIFNKVTFPLFAGIQNDDVKLKQAYKTMMRLVLTMSSSIMLVLIIVAEPMYIIVFGEKWLDAVPYFKILCIASIFLPINMYNLNILKVKGKTALYLRIDIAKKIIGVTCLLISLPFGISAMVWSLCITNIFFAYFNGFFSGKLINFPLGEQLVDSLKVVSLAFCPAIICFLVQQSFKLEAFSNYLAIIVYTVLYFTLFLFAVFFFNRSLFNDFKKLLIKNKTS